MDREKLLAFLEDMRREVASSPTDTLLAIQTIKDHVNAGIPIPEDLLPYVGKLVEDWESAEGNRNRVGLARRRNNREFAVYQTALIAASENITIPEAAAKVADEWFPVGPLSAEHIIQLHNRGGDFKPHRLMGKIHGKMRRREDSD